MKQVQVRGSSVHRLFADPSAAFRPAPLWVWNDEMTTERIREQLRELAEQGFGGAFVHPRPGLVTEYLSEEWFARWQDALDEAERLGLKLYIYDENSYPSGFAGGHVPSELPDCLANSVLFKEFDRKTIQEIRQSASPMLNKPGKPMRAFAMRCTDEDGPWEVVADVTHLPLKEWADFGDRFWTFELGVPETNSWLGGFAYTDLLRPEVTERFIASTHEAYLRRFGAQFGHSIPALFTDEPEISPGNLFEEGDRFLPFSYWFASEFEKRNGYDLRDYFPALFRDVRMPKAPIDPVRVRYDYYSTIHELWVKNAVKPVSEWCERNGLAYTGHYLEHQWPHPFGRTSPAVMSLYEYMHWPAIDMLETHLLKTDGTNPHLLISIREAHSAANQFGRERVLCEAYGAGGWDSTFEDYKRIGDWLFVHGINFLNQHLTYSTMVGARKRDHPQSFDWRQSWWEEYKRLNDYFARLSFILSQGGTHNRILVLNPTTSTFLLTPRDLEQNAEFRQETEEMRRLIQRLCDEQWDFDLGDEFILERHGGVEEDGKLRVEGRLYDLVVIPPGVKQLKRANVALLERFLSVGGEVFSMGEPPSRVDGELSDEGGRLARHSGWRRIDDAEKLCGQLEAKLPRRLEWQVAQGSLPQGVAHLRREWDDGSVFYFITNSSPQPIEGILAVPGMFAEYWDPFSGEIRPLSGERRGEKLWIPARIEASGSLLVRVLPESHSLAERSNDAITLLPAPARRMPCKEQAVKVRAERSNVFPILYCDLQAGTKQYRDIHTIHANRLAFEHHGFESNPWDNAIQFKRRLLERNGTFGESSGCKVTYRFYAEKGEYLRSIGLTVERPELYRVQVNGTPITNDPSPSRWDHHMGTWEIGHAVMAGENTITLTGRPFSIFMEIEPVYVTGDFAVESVDNRWTLVPAGELGIGSWREKGYPFYEGAILYSKKVSIGGGNKKVGVRIPEWKGSVAHVFVDGVSAGLIGIDRSNELEITPLVSRGGEFDVTVRICGSFRNLFGPHLDPSKPRNLAWPGAWKKSPLSGPPLATEFDLLDYGLLNDFVVWAE